MNWIERPFRGHRVAPVREFPKYCRYGGANADRRQSRQAIPSDHAWARGHGIPPKLSLPLIARDGQPGIRFGVRNIEAMTLVDSIEQTHESGQHHRRTYTPR